MKITQAARNLRADRIYKAMGLLSQKQVISSHLEKAALTANNPIEALSAKEFIEKTNRQQSELKDRLRFSSQKFFPSNEWEQN